MSLHFPRGPDLVKLGLQLRYPLELNSEIFLDNSDRLTALVKNVDQGVVLVSSNG